MADDPDTDEDLGITVVLPVLTLTSEQTLRAFILKHYCSSGDPSAVDGRILVENLDYIANWITAGKVPAKPRQQNRTLRAVEP